MCVTMDRHIGLGPTLSVNIKAFEYPKESFKITTKLKFSLALLLSYDICVVQFRVLIIPCFVCAGRMFDHHVLDMIELGIVKYRSLISTTVSIICCHSMFGSLLSD